MWREVVLVPAPMTPTRMVEAMGALSRNVRVFVIHQWSDMLFSNTPSVGTLTMLTHLIPALLLAAAVVSAQPGYTIETVAGSGRFEITAVPSDPLQLRMVEPSGLAVDPAGNIYFADTYHQRIFQITAEGMLSLFAGNGTIQLTDGAPAAETGLPTPIGLVFRDNELHFFTGAGLVKVTTSGRVQVLVPGDRIGVAPVSLAFARNGDAYFSDAANRVRRIDAAGEVTTVAGTGQAGFEGDGGPATSARLNLPRGLAVTADGSLLIADSGNHRIRRLRTDGIIETYAGTGVAGDLDGAPNTGRVAAPASLVALADGTVLVGQLNGSVRRIGANRALTTFGAMAANRAQILSADAVEAQSSGAILVFDRLQRRLYRITAAGDRVDTAAGANSEEGSGDGGPARDAKFLYPSAVAVLPDGSFLVGDEVDNRIRRVGADGVIQRFAGDGSFRRGADGSIADGAAVSQPRAFALDAEGSLYLATGASIRKVGADGILSTFAGGAGGGSQATEAVPPPRS